MVSLSRHQQQYTTVSGIAHKLCTSNRAKHPPGANLQSHPACCREKCQCPASSAGRHGGCCLWENVDRIRIVFLQFSFSLLQDSNYLVAESPFSYPSVGLVLHVKKAQLLNCMSGSLGSAVIQSLYVIDSKSLAEFPGRHCRVSLRFLLGDFLRILSVKQGCIHEEKQFLRYYFHEEAWNWTLEKAVVGVFYDFKMI